MVICRTNAVVNVAERNTDNVALISATLSSIALIDKMEL